MKKSEIKEKGAEYFSYSDLIRKYSPGLTYDSFPRIGVNLPNTCLNIWSGHSVNSSIIGCVHSNDNHPIGESRIEVIEQKNEWIKIRAINLYYVDDPGKEKGPDWGACPNTIHSELTGWIKIVDEKGFPKIWFSKE